MKDRQDMLNKTVFCALMQHSMEGMISIQNTAVVCAHLGDF